jgi:chaperonin cofactor prefoldin
LAGTQEECGAMNQEDRDKLNLRIEKLRNQERNLEIRLDQIQMLLKSALEKRDKIGEVKP